jgi:glutathione S-transferase
LEKRLAKQPYLLGDNLTVLDIAWLIYQHRLSLGGYPFARLHPRVSAWVEKLRTRAEFSKEIAMPAEAVTRLENTRRAQTQAGETLEAVAGF